MIVAYNTFMKRWLLITIMIIFICISCICVYLILRKDIEAQKEANIINKKLAEEMERYNDIEAYKEASKIYNTIKDDYK